ncbi:MAG: hypothetical protein AB7O66_17990 [Limisphaerales bacterium]
MSYDDRLAECVRAFLVATGGRVEEKRMMGGLCFMVEGPPVEIIS